MRKIAPVSLTCLIALLAWSTSGAQAAFTYSTSLVYQGTTMSSLAYGTGSNNVGGANTIYSLSSQSTTALGSSGPLTLGSQTYTPQAGNGGTFIDTTPGNSNPKLLIVITITDTTTMASGSITVGDTISGTIGGNGATGFDPYKGSLSAGSYFVDQNGFQTSTPASLTLGTTVFTIPTNGSFVNLFGELTSTQSPPLQLGIVISSTVPEPSSLVLMAIGGLGSLAFAGRRKLRDRSRS